MATRIDISESRFRQILPLVCQKDTAQAPELWIPDNPLHSHCAPVSLLACDLFGLGIVYGDAFDLETFQSLGKHFLNRRPNGELEDFTAEQYINTDLAYYRLLLMEKDEILRDVKIADLYNRLSARFHSFLQNPINIIHQPKLSFVEV